MKRFNHSLQRTRRERRGYHRCVPCAGPASLGRSAASKVSTLVVLLALSGCMMPLPLPLVLPSSSHRVVSGSRIRTDDLAFVRLGETSRAEVTQRFGAPWADYTDLHVTVYYWEALRGWIGPIGGGAGEELTRLDVLFIRFDEEIGRASCRERV